MGNFNNIKDALEYIDGHLDEPMSFESLAERFHFSPYYFHRMFTAIVGKAIAAYIRDRKLLRACARLASSGDSILRIGLDCGYGSAQSFARAFHAAYGMPPSEYRRQGIAPAAETVDEMIMKFTNRLRGGIYVNPKIIRRGALSIAGLSGEGSETARVWASFMKLSGEKPIKGRLSGNGYEIRVFDGSSSAVHVGHAVSGPVADEAYSVRELPASEYASFDVYVANGYESENDAMAEWLETNRQGYSVRLLDGARYCVEYYDERFNGSEAGSIVEIWLPIKKA